MIDPNPEAAMLALRDVQAVAAAALSCWPSGDDGATVAASAAIAALRTATDALRVVARRAGAA